MPLSGCGRSEKPSKGKGASVPVAQVVTTCTPAQNPAITTVAGPNDIGCGGFEWKVWFDLPDAAAKDGWVIQEINVTYDVKAADGSGVNQMTSHYWEAWEVKAGQKGTVWQQNKLDDNDDAYNSSSFPGTKGSVHCVGLAKFYEGPLPADFKTNNPKTLAGILHSSDKKPACWDGTGTAHNIDSVWDCTGPAKTSKVTGQAGNHVVP